MGQQGGGRTGHQGGGQTKMDGQGTTERDRPRQTGRQGGGQAEKDKALRGGTDRVPGPGCVRLKERGQIKMDSGLVGDRQGADQRGRQIKMDSGLTRGRL